MKSYDQRLKKIEALHDEDKGLIGILTMPNIIEAYRTGAPVRLKWVQDTEQNRRMKPDYIMNHTHFGRYLKKNKREKNT